MTIQRQITGKDSSSGLQRSPSKSMKPIQWRRVDLWREWRRFKRGGGRQTDGAPPLLWVCVCPTGFWVFVSSTRPLWHGVNLVEQNVDDGYSSHWSARVEEWKRGARQPGGPAAYRNGRRIATFIGREGGRAGKRGVHFYFPLAHRWLSAPCWMCSHSVGWSRCQSDYAKATFLIDVLMRFTHVRIELL